jgi:hypothetical protein
MRAPCLVTQGGLVLRSLLFYPEIVCKQLSTLVHSFPIDPPVFNLDCLEKQLHFISWITYLSRNSWRVCAERSKKYSDLWTMPLLGPAPRLRQHPSPASAPTEWSVQFCRFRYWYQASSRELSEWRKCTEVRDHREISGREVIVYKYELQGLTSTCSAVTELRHSHMSQKLESDLFNI